MLQLHALQMRMKDFWLISVYDISSSAFNSSYFNVFSPCISPLVLLARFTFRMSYTFPSASFAFQLHCKWGWNEYIHLNKINTAQCGQFISFQCHVQLSPNNHIINMYAI